MVSGNTDDRQNVIFIAEYPGVQHGKAADVDRMLSIFLYVVPNIHAGIQAVKADPSSQKPAVTNAAVLSWTRKTHEHLRLCRQLF